MNPVAKLAYLIFRENPICKPTLSVRSYWCLHIELLWILSKNNYLVFFACRHLARVGCFGSNAQYTSSLWVVVLLHQASSMIYGHLVIIYHTPYFTLQFSSSYYGMQRSPGHVSQWKVYRHIICTDVMALVYPNIEWILCFIEQWYVLEIVW